MRETGLDKKQLTNWFTNARKRIWQPRYGPTPKSKQGAGDGGSGGAAVAEAATAAPAATIVPAAAASVSSEISGKAPERKRSLTPVTAPSPAAAQKPKAVCSPKAAKLHAATESTLSPPSVPLSAVRAAVEPELQLFEFNDEQHGLLGGEGTSKMLPGAAELLLSMSPVDESMFSDPYSASWLEPSVC